MQHRKRTALIAGLFTITCLAQISMNTMSGDCADGICAVLRTPLRFSWQL